MYEEIVDRLISYPQRSQIKIDFDTKKKIFYFHTCIFSSKDMPESVKKYVESRKNSTFKPHTTSFKMEGNRVILNQEVSFQMGFQGTLRKNVDHFWQMSRECHRMLSELAVEETYQNALHLDTHFEE